jgi:predicted dinucleotide-binding enzyme
MNDNTSEKSRLTLLGLGAMGSALARAWLADGHPLTVWNRTAGGVSAELLTPFMALMERRLADGHGDEDTTGVIGLLTR